MLQKDSAITASIGQTVAHFAIFAQHCTSTDALLSCLMERNSAISASMGKTVAPKCNLCPNCTCTSFYVFSNVLTPVELNTAPMGIKLGSYPRLSANRICYKGIALSLRQSARWSPHFAIFAQHCTCTYFCVFRKFCHLLSLILL